MARTKHTAKKRTVQEDNRCSQARPSQAGKVPRKELTPNKPSGKEKPVPPGVVGIKCTEKTSLFLPGTKALMEIRWFQISADLLVPKILFYRVVRELLQEERPWFKIQVAVVMALHEEAEAYLI